MPSTPLSAHSLSVTATTSCPARRASSAATALSTPPLIADQHSPRRRLDADVLTRPHLRQARCSASAARSAAWRLPGESPPSSATSLRADPRRIEQGRILGQQHARAGGRERRAAALRVEGDLGHPAGGGPDRDPHQIAAHMPAGAADERTVGHRPAAIRLTQMLFETHAGESRGAARRCIARGRGRGDKKPAGQGWSSTGFQVSQGTRLL